MEFHYGEPTKTGDIAFLGPAGTYCDQAARSFAKRMGMEQCTLVPCRSFRRVFDAVENEQVEFGVVAIENSIEGPITATLDTFAEADLATILGEQVIDINHCLVMDEHASVEGIKAIVSHQQALAQCRRYLEKHFPTTPVHTARSTSEAAQMAAGNPDIAGIANAQAAELAGVRIHAQGIQDHDQDQTSFVLIAKQGHQPVFEGEGKMKTSLALYLQSDRPGALQMILSEFAYSGINLTKIQSRPTKRKLGEYMFFIDLEGSVDDPEVAVALECLRLKLRDVRILGCYPYNMEPAE